MIDLFKSAVVGQFHAALSMLKAAVDQCPDEHWQLWVGNWQFSHVAYHALFYADFYLSPDEGSYCRPEFYREEYEFFGATKLPPDQEPIADVPFPREDVLRYIEHCRRKASEIIAAETEESLAGPPGFWWYKIPAGRVPSEQRAAHPAPRGADEPRPAPCCGDRRWLGRHGLSVWRRNPGPLKRPSPAGDQYVTPARSMMVSSSETSVPTLAYCNVRPKT